MLMDERKFRILQAIIDDYILTAIPVGSRTISKKYEMGLSSATIRNEMSDLEELGYLDQPHVSAGRIPSAKAYRLYVDQLLQKGILPESSPEGLQHYFTDRAQQMEDVISRAAQVLSGLTHYTALVMSPKGKALRIRNIQLVPVTSQKALLVIVTDGGILRDTLIQTGRDLDTDTLYAISRMLTERLSGRTFSEAVALLERGGLGAEPVPEDLVDFFRTVESDSSKTRLALGSPSNLLDYPEYSDVEKAKAIFNVLETKDKLVKLMESQGEMAFTVRIGPETGIPELEGCSLVTASYHLGDQSHGTMGIIGPTRMQYGKVLGILHRMGQQLSDILTEEKE